MFETQGAVTITLQTFILLLFYLVKYGAANKSISEYGYWYLAWVSLVEN